jgi:fructose-bisphosphate aldolase class I
MKSQELRDTATMLFANSKGLLAMDESNPTCNRRFASLGIPQTEEARRAYRELIVTTQGSVSALAALSSTTKQSVNKRGMELRLSKFSWMRESFLESRWTWAPRI